MRLRNQFQMYPMKLVSQLGRIALFIFFVVFIPAISSSQGLPAIPNVISRMILEFQGEMYAVEIEAGKDARVAEGGLYCANPNEKPELECKNCSLVLKLGQRELSRISLGPYKFVYDEGQWHVTGAPPINMLKGKADLPLIVVSQYASCNGHFYQFYWIDVKNGLTLKPVRFVGVATREKENQLYASMNFKNAIRFVETSRFYGRELWVGGYDNAGVGSFLVQFGESSPGQWSCIGFYSDAGGGLPEMQKKLSGK